MGSLGPGPGCKELVAGYLQFIISPVIASRVLTLPGSPTNTSGAGAGTCWRDVPVPRCWDGAAGWQLSGEGLHVELLPRLVPQPWPALTCQGFPVPLLPPLPVGGTWPASAGSSCP